MLLKLCYQVIHQVADKLPRFLLNLSDLFENDVYPFLNVTGVDCCAVATLIFNYFEGGYVKVSGLFFAPIMQKFLVTIIALLC